MFQHVNSKKKKKQIAEPSGWSVTAFKQPAFSATELKPFMGSTGNPNWANASSGRLFNCADSIVNMPKYIQI